jgi:hypothetical protein
MGSIPAISGAWIISNEKFFQPLDFFSTFKLRASWGKLGNQEIGNYPYSSLIGVGQYVYSFGGNVVTGAQLQQMGNNKIKWESSTQYDFGIDFSLFNERLAVMIDYYNKTSNDVLVRVPIPQTGRSNSSLCQCCIHRKQGLELSVILNNKYREINYSIGANVSTLKNQVLSLSGGEPILGGFGLSDGAITKTEVGYPVGSFFL